MLPPTLPLFGLRSHSCLDSWALLRPVRDCSRALCCVSGCLSRPCPCSVRYLSWLLCCLVLRRLWGPVVGDAGARKRSPALCATAHGRFAAYPSVALDGSPTTCVVFRCRCAASCSAARGGPLSRSPLPEPVGAPPPCARRLAGASLPIALPLLIAPLLCVLSPLVVALSPDLLSVELLRLVLLGSWAPLCRLCDCSWALDYLVLCPAALGRSPGPCVVFLGRCVVSYSTAPEAPLLVVPGLVGAPPPSARLLEVLRCLSLCCS